MEWGSSRIWAVVVCKYIQSFSYRNLEIDLVGDVENCGPVIWIWPKLLLSRRFPQATDHPPKPP